MVNRGDASEVPNGGLYYPSGNWIAAIYERGYPFEIWEEKIRSLEVPSPSPFALYAIAEALLVLTDTYATTLTASLMNPPFRWLAVERFASPGRVAFVSKLLGTESIDTAWSRLMNHPAFITLKAADAKVQDGKVVMSVLIGNPARRDTGGKVRLKYNPGWLLQLASSALRFRDTKRRILNAVKHGYRLPMYRPEELDLIVADIRASHSPPGNVQDPCQLREQVENSGLSPVFWLLETPEGKDRDPTRSPRRMEASLTLYGIHYRRALEHSRLLLDLLGLLFDRKRSGSLVENTAEAVGDSPFKSVLERICWMPVAMDRTDEVEAHVARLFVPDDRMKKSHGEA